MIDHVRKQAGASHDMSLRIRCALAAMLALGAGTARADAEYRDRDESPVVARSGDLLQFGIPLVALGMTYLYQHTTRTGFHWQDGALVGGNDFDLSMTGAPRHDLALGFARMELAVYGLKYGIDATRPNGSEHSFPSGHTAAAFLGAEFIRKEYGWAWGGPAYALASYVGWTRVVSGNHWPRDVFAGAAIGILSNYDLDDIDTPLGRISIVPLLRGPGRSDDLSGFSSSWRDGPGFGADRSIGVQFDLRF